MSEPANNHLYLVRTDKGAWAIAIYKDGAWLDTYTKQPLSATEWKLLGVLAADSDGILAQAVEDAKEWRRKRSEWEAME